VVVVVEHFAGLVERVRLGTSGLLGIRSGPYSGTRGHGSTGLMVPTHAAARASS
jgi:hypothetical protein